MQDLNVKPKLPFEDDSFDIITNVVRARFSHLSLLLRYQVQELHV